MFTIRIAGMNICINNKYEYIKNMCSDYIVKDREDFILEAAEEEIKREKLSENIDSGYAESLAIYRKIAEKIILKNGFLLHGVVAEYKGTGIAFLARSGTGKSTHAALWKELFGNDFIYVNGDKPLITLAGEKIYAHGTPWAGKENLQNNMHTELKKVCFIFRSKTNECRKLKKTEVLELLMKQIYVPQDANNFLLLLSHITKFINEADFYKISCNISKDAAIKAHEVIFGECC